MVTLIIELGPEQQATYSYSNTISFSIRHLHNLAITNILPRTTTADTTGAFIHVPEITWYTRGVLLWTQANLDQGASFILETYSSALIAAGLHIAYISTQSNTTQPHELTFAPGTLQERGFTIRVDLNQLMQQARRAANSQPSHYLPPPRNLSIQTHSPLPREQRATSDQPSHPGLVRHIERHINQRREEHLKRSSLF